MSTPSNAVAVPLKDHYTALVTALEHGEVVFFLGAGVNLCGCPNENQNMLGNRLPSGRELANYLANSFKLETSGQKNVKCTNCKSEFSIPNPIAEMEDLTRVSQNVVGLRGGEGPLKSRLQEVFQGDHPPTVLHIFLAELPGLLRGKKRPPAQFIVTTNYDDVLEKVFQKEKVPFDLVYYDEGRGRFWHVPYLAPEKKEAGEKEATVEIVTPNEYSGLPLDKNFKVSRTVIVKIHGTVNQHEQTKSSFVITEDHYIDYLARSELSNLLPVQLIGKLQNSNCLFLGYSLRDWNLRVILNRIWGKQPARWMSWAIQRHPLPIDQHFWSHRGVEIFNADLKDYIVDLRNQVEELKGNEEHRTLATGVPT